MNKDLVIIGDIHLDFKNGDENFLRYQKTFFDNILKLLEKKEEKPMVVFLGDIFTNNNVIDIKTLAYFKKLLFDIYSKTENPIILINGNHDKVYKDSYELFTPELIFSDLNNIKLIIPNSYFIIEDCLFVSWRNDIDEYINVFESINNRNNINYIFGHFEIQGFSTSKFSEHKNKKSLTGTEFKKYFPKMKKVFSGHFHIPQENNNIRYVGIPYQLTWGEDGLSLGVNILRKDGKLEYYENPKSIFKYVEIKTINDIKNFKEEYVNNPSCFNMYYKISFDDKNLKNDIYDLKETIEKDNNKVTLIQNFSYSQTDDIFETKSILEDSGIKYSGKFNLMDMASFYIDNFIEHDDKNSFKNKFNSIYNSVIKDLNKNFEI